MQSIERQYVKLASTAIPSKGEYAFYRSRGLRAWEPVFVPEEWFYDEVLKHLEEKDVVFDVGAGDLRFDLIMSQHVKKVYAVEVNPITLAYALKTIGYKLPRNLIPICANALDLPLPEDVTTITILMIHRTWDIPYEWRKKKIIYTTRNHGVVMIPPMKETSSNLPLPPQGE